MQEGAGGYRTVQEDAGRCMSVHAGGCRRVQEDAGGCGGSEERGRVKEGACRWVPHRSVQRVQGGT